MAPSDTTFLCVFYAFSLAGQLIITACLLTVVCARLPRDLTLINLAISGLTFATACLMLLFAQKFRGPPPPFRLCLAQACLIYGSLAIGYASEIVCGLFMLASLLLQLHVGYIIFRGWAARTLRREVLPLDSIVRMGIFTYAGPVTVPLPAVH
ncbi:hypothetical protein AURDEDRAFT_166472 [Auricularia subglabra TFB-10046 SS5]|nr:hypothetical protein AURDEDRAFT_166472 [Auricularia subglabra TFB-10046 SS5]